MSISQNDPSQMYTYADYLTWPEGERWEIIDGVAYMQAAPTWQHQAIAGDIFAQFYDFLKDKPCRVFTAPFDVCISKDNESDEEISSPSTARRDKLIKFNQFEMAGLGEYWIVEPENKLVNVFVLQENKRYGRPDIYSDEDQIKVITFPDLIIDLKSVFANL